MKQLLQLLRLGQHQERFGQYGPEWIAWKSISTMHSYRIPATDNSKWLLLRYLPGCIRWVLSAKPLVVEAPGSKEAVLHIAPKGEDRNHEYLCSVRQPKALMCLYKSNLGPISNAHRFRLLWQLLPLLWFLLRATWRFPDRYRNLAFALRECLETACLLQLLQHHHIERVYMFGGFEKDANLFALACQSTGIYIHKIPSSNSLIYFYTYLIADELALTTAYHQEEANRLLGMKWNVGKLSEWPPMNAHRLHVQLPTYRKPPPQSLGFYSRGAWFRKVAGDSSRNAGELASEFELIRQLRAYHVKHPQVNLTVFLHPIERSNLEAYQKAEGYYRTVIGSSVQVYPFGKDTLEGFDAVDVAISSYSSSNIERLYCGFKTLFAPLHMKNPLFNTRVMQPITILDAEQVEPVINKTLALSRQAFFAQENLSTFLAASVQLTPDSLSSEEQKIA
ncbi:MAG: hypothetical protein ACFB10_11350 [Salibacteraceae bacterium]